MRNHRFFFIQIIIFFSRIRSYFNLAVNKGQNVSILDLIICALKS